MNWKFLRHAPWLDTRAKFVSATPLQGNLLDLGSSDGETLRHFSELRPDLQLHAVDIVDQSIKYPAGCQFRQVNLETEKLPWPDQSMDAVTCLHLVEHLNSLDSLVREIARVLKPGARVYLETPHPKTLALGSLPGPEAGTFTMNFFDDPTHTKIVPIGTLAQKARKEGLEIMTSGTSRNLLFVAANLLRLGRTPRQKATARIHWIGWSAYMIATRRLHS